MPRPTDALRALVEGYLAELDFAPYLGSLEEPMRHALGGKRVRPVLCLATGDAIGATVENLLPAAALVVVVQCRQVVVDERERVHELERAARGERLLGLDTGGLGRREAEHGPDALAADRDRVVDRLCLPMQIRPQRERLEALLDERAQLLRASGHRPPPHASPARSPPAPPSRARSARP